MANSNWGVIKAKVKCNDCGDVIEPTSNHKFTECSCGATKIKGKGMFRIIEGKNYQDLSKADFKNVPPHKEWDARSDDK